MRADSIRLLSAMVPQTPKFLDIHSWSTRVQPFIEFLRIGEVVHSIHDLVSRLATKLFKKQKMTANSTDQLYSLEWRFTFKSDADIVLRDAKQ